MNWSLIVSIAAVIVAVVTAFVQWKHGKRLLELEREREQERRLAPKRANIAIAFRQRNTITLGGNPPSTTYNCDLIVRNEGPRQARNVVVRIDGAPPEESPYTDAESPSVIDPNAGRVFKLKVTDPSGVPVKVSVLVTWTDDSGQAGRVEAQGIIAA